MAAKTSKVFLQMAGRDHHVKTQHGDQWLYRVVRLVNTLEPRVDSIVNEASVLRMINEGVDVTISPRPDR